jgi:putative pyruvate formate lyase activating enzyme
MLALQERGCHNINLVTPEHVAPQVIEALAVAVPAGLRVPVVYNTSAYDALSSLRLLDGLIDIYMPDFKFWTRENSRRLAKAKDYPERAREAILEMHQQVGDLRFGNDGLARRGLLIRYLVMPGQQEEASAIFRWLADNVSADTYVNIMEQYRPEYQVRSHGGNSRPEKYPDIGRQPYQAELDAVYQAAREAGLWRFDKR